MSNINPHALFRKFPFLEQYYNVNKIHVVDVCLLGPDILARRLRPTPYLDVEWIRPTDVCHSVQEILFLDKEGNCLRRKKKRSDWGNQTVGSEYFSLRRREDVQYITLWVAICESKFGDNRWSYTNHLTFCKPRKEHTLAEGVDNLLKIVEADMMNALQET